MPVSPRSSCLAFLSLLTGCATIMGGGGPWAVPIDSVPQGAIVAYGGANVGVTPCTVSMTSRHGCVATLRLDGFHDQPVDAGKSTNGMILGNVLFGGFVGLMVDAASGSTATISTEPCWVELTPASEPMPDVWHRPRRRAQVAEDEGWVPEGQASATAKKIEIKPTRAPTRIERSGRTDQHAPSSPDF